MFYKFFYLGSILVFSLLH